MDSTSKRAHVNLRNHPGQSDETGLTVVLGEFCCLPRIARSSTGVSSALVRYLCIGGTSTTPCRVQGIRRWRRRVCCRLFMNCAGSQVGQNRDRPQFCWGSSRSLIVPKTSRALRQCGALVWIARVYRGCLVGRPTASQADGLG